MTVRTTAAMLIVNAHMRRENVSGADATKNYLVLSTDYFVSHPRAAVVSMLIHLR